MKNQPKYFQEIFSDLVDGGCDINWYMNMPSATYPPQLMLGSSHFQMRNDDNARDAFNKLLRKDDNNPQFFWFNSDQ